MTSDAAGKTAVPRQPLSIATAATASTEIRSAQSAHAASSMHRQFRPSAAWFDARHSRSSAADGASGHLRTDTTPAESAPIQASRRQRGARPAACFPGRGDRRQRTAVHKAWMTIRAPLRMKHSSWGRPFDCLYIHVNSPWLPGYRGYRGYRAHLRLSLQSADFQLIGTLGHFSFSIVAVTLEQLNPTGVFLGCLLRLPLVTSAGHSIFKRPFFLPHERSKSRPLIAAGHHPQGECSPRVMSRIQIERIDSRGLFEYCRF